MQQFGSALIVLLVGAHSLVFGCSTGTGEGGDGTPNNGGAGQGGAGGFFSGDGAAGGDGGALLGTGGVVSVGGSDNEVSGGANTGGASSGGGSSGGGPADGSHSGGSHSGGSHAGSTGGGGALGVYPTPDCPPSIDLGVRIVGRHDGCDDAGVTMAWSGTGFVARFSGEGLRFTQSGGPVQYTVVVDGQLASDLSTMEGEHSYQIAGDLSAGEHLVEIYRRSEANFGPVVLRSVDVDAGQLLPPPPAPARRIEILGDSITCGYGNEGTTPSCPFSADTENHYMSYGAILARSLEAELSTVAWSGKGVVTNYGGDTSTTLVQMVDRAIPTSELSVWDYSLVKAPDALIINLGTNDYSTDNDPSDLDFVSTYVAMLEIMRTRYPDAFILCTLGPMLSGSDLDVARTNIAAAVGERQQAGDARVQSFELEPNNPSPGCDYHPNLSTHASMASVLQVPLQAVLGW